MRARRLGLIAAAAAVVLASLGGPAPVQAQSPAETVDVHDFVHRAQRWSEARKRARQEALQRAQELADQARSTTTTTTTTTAPPTTTTAAPATTTTTTAPPPTTTETESEPPATTASSVVEHPLPEGTTEEQWHALRECESTQNYRAISRSGRYRGAYQFSIATWNWVAGMHYPELVGVDPRDASPSDQDKMAYTLYEINGWNPWPTCRKRLPS